MVEAPVASSGGGARRRQVIVLLCAACAFISIADRSSLSVLVIDMKEELRWSPHQESMIMSSFYYGYVCSQLAGAHFGGVFGPAKLLGCALFGWSVLTLLTPFAARTSPAVMIMTRVCLGLLEGLTYPLINSIFGYWVPPSERGRALAVSNIGAGLGAISSLALAPVVSNTYGWAVVLYGSGWAGIALSVVWGLVAKDKPDEPVDWEDLSPTNQHTQQQQHKLATAQSNQGPSTISESFQIILKMLASPSIAVLAFVHFCNNTGSMLNGAWFPTVLHDLFGVSGSDLWVVCLPYWCQMAGAMLCGTYVDHVQGQYKDVTVLRKQAILIGLSGGAIFLVVLSRAATMEVAVGAYCFERFFVSGGLIAGLEPAKFEVVAAEQAGLVQALTNTCGAFAGMLAVPLAAYAVEITGDWRSVFVVVAAVYMVAIAAHQKYADSARVVLGNSRRVITLAPAARAAE